MVTFHQEWQRPPEAITLHDGVVDLWVLALNQPEAVVARLGEYLTTEEHNRADHFVFPHLRANFTVARGALRHILSQYVGQPPKHVQFGYGERGKPYLLNGDIRFNLSHSGEVALLGVTRRREIGVDIEQTRNLSDLESLARRNFSASENTALMGLPISQRTDGFFNCWTRKEAYIKALGDGFSYPLDQFDVTLRPGEAARLLKVVGQPGEVLRWRLQSLVPAAGYIGAVIVEGQDWIVQQWLWDAGAIVPV